MNENEILDILELIKNDETILNKLNFEQLEIINNYLLTSNYDGLLQIINKGAESNG